MSIFSCAVACYKSHTSSDCTVNSQDTPAVQVVQNTQLYPTEDTIPPEKLNLLCMYIVNSLS